MPLEMRNASGTAPPSGLPAIPPSSGEIGSFANLAFLFNGGGLAKARTTFDLPLEGRGIAYGVLGVEIGLRRDSLG
ncbi:hypothetical protein FJ492_28500, partial [Mesorhizobium sp. B2-5-4]